MALGIYIHVPFCRTRCSFCAFYLRIHREDWAQAYVEALAREIRLYAAQDRLGGRLPDSLYFGGGTPTTLQPEQLVEIYALVRDSFGLARQAEVTVEAHPDSVTEEGLQTLRVAGFNRISFGLQSADEEELLQVGRKTDGASVNRAVAHARAAGFANLNLDLIYGLPGQTLASWHETLAQALALAPTHLSCYALTVEDKTHLQVSLHRGDLPEPDQDLQNTMEDQAALRLAEAGFDRYEISNYSRPGHACRHNLLYWQGGEYLGLGPSAQSYLNGCRFGNVEDLTAYRDQLASGRLATAQTEQLSPAQRQREALVFGLRLTDGVRLSGSLAQSADQWEQKLQRLKRDGLIELAADRVRLTALGRRFADQVAVELL
nr:radical SAM family heme chaperone HemW [Nitrospirota bacterium]